MTSMRIGLNGQKLLIEKLAGPELYTLNTFREFAKNDHKNGDDELDNVFWFK